MVLRACKMVSHACEIVRDASGEPRADVRIRPDLTPRLVYRPAFFPMPNRGFTALIAYWNPHARHRRRHVRAEARECGVAGDPAAAGPGGRGAAGGPRRRRLRQRPAHVDVLALLAGELPGRARPRVLRRR